MLENLSAYWYLWLLLAVLIIITAVVCKKSYAASKRHSSEVRKKLAEKQRTEKLVSLYASPSTQTIEDADPAELFEGLALSLEERCQKADDINKEFDSFTDGQKKIYSFYYLATDCKNESPSFFFRNSKKPLTEFAAEAANDILDKDAAGIIKALYDCFDEDNESCSVIPEQITRLDSSFTEALNGEDLFTLGGNHIKSAAKEFASE